jgi:SecD/SecF fusion protein
VTFSTPKPTSLSLVRTDVSAIGGNDAVVQGQGASTGQDYKAFQIRLKKLSSPKQDSLTAELTSSLHAEKLGVTNVSASFSRQILDGAILAIAVSFALIALYVTFRYRWRFAVPILRTLVNDIPIVGGVYALSGREVTADTVAAVLTILGYSIYDTIIVFDRIRENMRLMPKASIGTIANVSVSEVLKRSIVTSTITLLPIVALFLFGGATLRDFAFAIIVGIAVGAVSTIFIATPLLVGLMERDPEYAGRRTEILDRPARGRALRRAEQAAANEPTPETPMDEVEKEVGKVIGRVTAAAESSETKRARRRQRRAARPHGRPR